MQLLEKVIKTNNYKHDVSKSLKHLKKEITLHVVENSAKNVQKNQENLLKVYAFNWQVKKEMQFDQDRQT